MFLRRCGCQWVSMEEVLLSPLHAEEKVGMQEVLFILPSLNRWCLVILVQNLACRKFCQKEVPRVDGEEFSTSTKLKSVSCAGVIRSGGTTS